MSSCGKNENPQEMNRRKFLKVFGGGAVASSAALYGCAPKNEPGAAVALGEVPTDKMTYRHGIIFGSALSSGRVKLNKSSSAESADAISAPIRVTIFSVVPVALKYMAQTFFTICIPHFYLF